MQKISIIAFALLFSMVTLSCSSTGTKEKKKSLLEKEIEMIENDNAGKELTALSKMFALKAKYGEKVVPIIEKRIQKLSSTLIKNKLDDFKSSPNKKISVPSNTARIHLKNNYPSGNMVIMISKNGKPALLEFVPFNTEEKFDIPAGTYTLDILIDRSFNNNKYLFSRTTSLRGGELYLGEFTVQSSYNKSGSCPDNTIADDDTCMTVFIRAFDNCPAGTNLVEHLCCEEGKNFILDGKCSRYSDKIDRVICPAGTHQAGKGRCCPNGTELIDGQCRKPENKEK